MSLEEKQYIRNLASQSNISYIDLDLFDFGKSSFKFFREKECIEYKIIELNLEDDILSIGMVNPFDLMALDFIRKSLKDLKFKRFIIDEEKFHKTINSLNIRNTDLDLIQKEFLNNYENFNLDTIEENSIDITSSPLVKLVDSIIVEGVRKKASDIHIEPNEDYVRVRYRIDGDLIELLKLPLYSILPIITRIKIIASMNIAEKRLPQDGKFKMVIDGKDIDFRTSSLPTIHGEKVSIRILDNYSFDYKLLNLGFSKKQENLIRNLLRQPYGMILATGPTGSGKTSTIYSLINEINSSDKNIITIEDPVEYRISGANQINVNKKAGLDFAIGLRSILRADPDFILIGEIRDEETARIAVRSSITGHKVFSTLHTNDCPSTIGRLIDMGIEPYLLSSALSGVISQKLVKLLCEECKKPYIASMEEKKSLKVENLNEDLILYKAVGCDLCNEGYKGRIGVFEVMVITRELRKLINESNDLITIKNQALKEGMVELKKSLSNLIIKGKTSYDSFYSLENLNE